MSSLLINFEQACMSGRRIEGLNLIQSGSSVVSAWVSALVTASISESPGKKCFNLLTLIVFNLFFHFQLGNALVDKDDEGRTAIFWRQLFVFAQKVCFQIPHLLAH
jgi:hypothetical protein